MARSNISVSESQKIQQEIEACLGFFPPFFEPALATPMVLRSLWQQTLTAYVQNPLPALFKEKLAALLARYCTVPYCLMCHSASLRPLGLSAQQVLELLQAPPLSLEQLREELAFLEDHSQEEGWPEAGSPREKVVLNCSLAVFQGGDPLCQERLKGLLSPQDYAYLTLFLLYNRTCLSWAEANPSLAYEADRRVQEHLGPLLAEQPALADFFSSYLTRMQEQESRRLEFLRSENRRLQAEEVRQQDLERQVQALETRFAAVLSQAPVAIALLSGPEHSFEFFNESYRSLSGNRQLAGLTVRQAFPELDGLGFYEALDSVFHTGVEHRQHEARVVLRRGEEMVTTYQDYSYCPLRNAQSEVEGVIVVAHDVSATVAARETVKNQELWLRAVLDALPVGLLMVEPGSGRYLFANRQTERIFGNALISPAEDLDYGQRLHVTDLQGQRIDSDQLPSRRAARGEQLVNHQAIWHTATGPHCLSINTQLIDAQHGHSNTVLVAFADVSDLKQTERALQENEAGLAIALDVSRVGYWSYDPSNGKIHLSPQLKEDWGIPDTAEADSLDYALALIHPQDRPQVEASIQEALASQQPYRVEYRVLHAQTGETVWIEARGRTVKDEGGRSVGLVGTSQNISEIKQTQLMLEGSLAQMRRLADSMPQIVWTARPDGVLDYTNRRWTEYSGNNQPERWLEFVHPDDQPGAVESWSRSLISGELYNAEFRLRRVDESDRWHLVRAEAVRDGGRVVAWYGTCTDVHDIRKLTEDLQSARLQAEHANRTKSAFLANMSHEIRTPLAAILGYAEILKDDTLESEERLEFLTTISRNGSALTRLIDDILDLSKVEAGQIDPEHVDFSLLELLSEVRALFEEQARAKGLLFAIESGSDLPERVRTDPSRLRQILINLVGNALKFTSQGSVQVLAELEGEQLRFTVQDTGIGLTEQQASRLFQPFAQGDGSTTRRFGGTGLGLALSRKLARALGGDVWLEARPEGAGCRFVATVAAAASEAARSSAQALPATPQLQGLRVLLVEDTADNQRLITHVLERAGAVVELAQDGQEGVDKALAGNFEVVLMDMQMPRLDGFTATRMLRQRGYRGPVVALTAHAMTDDRERIQDCGCDAHLTKPLDFNDIYLTLQRLSTGRLV